MVTLRLNRAAGVEVRRKTGFLEVAWGDGSDGPEAA